MANGLSGDGPAQALRDQLVAEGARVVTIFHPLARHEGGRHVITTYGAGKRLRVRTVHVPFRP
ncbi:MAG: hypothetical protein E6G03_07695, partial [Actinobacteria bacterium]